MAGMYRTIWSFDPARRPTRKPAPVALEPFHGLGLVARAHARKGVPVFPVAAGAAGPPLVPPSEATTDAAQIVTWWWGQYIDANIGTPDGRGGYKIMPGSIIDGEMVEAESL
jgi:hypothetical protein